MNLSEILALLALILSLQAGPSPVVSEMVDVSAEQRIIFETARDQGFASKQAPVQFTGLPYPARGYYDPYQKLIVLDVRRGRLADLAHEMSTAYLSNWTADTQTLEILAALANAGDERYRSAALEDVFGKLMTAALWQVDDPERVLSRLDLDDEQLERWRTAHRLMHANGATYRTYYEPVLNNALYPVLAGELPDLNGKRLDDTYTLLFRAGLVKPPPTCTHAARAGECQ